MNTVWGSARQREIRLPQSDLSKEATFRDLSKPVGALTPEVLTNMAMVGRNPAATNQLLTTALQAARALPAPGWSMRLSPARATVDGDEDAPADEPVLDNPSEALLHRLRVQVLARIRGAGASSRVARGYSARVCSSGVSDSLYDIAGVRASQQRVQRQ